MKKIITAAQFDGYSNRKDKTVAMRFITQEMTPDQVAHIHGMIDSFGYMYFKAESEITSEERLELDALETDLFDNPKTQSQRIRNVMYRVWQQKPEGFKDFKDFYKFKTEQIITWLKSKLP